MSEKAKRPGWNLGCAITCLSPIVAAGVSLALMWPYGDDPLGWTVVAVNGVVAAFGSALGPMFVRKPLPSKAFGAVVCAPVGLAAYLFLFYCGVALTHEHW